MSYKKRNGKEVKDEVSSATQMEPGRDRMQSISPPTSLPTPACLHSLTSVCVGVCVCVCVGRSEMQEN